MDHNLAVRISHIYRNYTFLGFKYNRLPADKRILESALKYFPNDKEAEDCLNKREK